MKAMILAAGVGERMRPLTDSEPKPLLRAGGVPLIEYHLRRLAPAGVREVVINVSHLAQRIVDYCDDGARWDLDIHYSREESPLETAGGIVRALPLLGMAPFLVVNGDIWTDYPFERLAAARLRAGELARLVMIDNRSHHPEGDFALDASGWLRPRGPDTRGRTYAGIGLYTAEFFGGVAQGVLPMRPLLDAAIARGALGGEYFEGAWEDVGTPERLRALDERLR